ncbi:MAG: amidohydrolase family protein [Bryobacteraceae bacterium]|nr:amidohydrolase family protein [Bryobacteraceae bacterium]
MAERLLIRGARQLLTLRGPSSPRRGHELRELAIIEDGALLIEDGLIREVGPSRRIENLNGARDAQEIDATGRVVAPGFVDCETDLLGAARAARATVSPARLELEASQRLRWFVRHGTTSLGVSVNESRDHKTIAALNGEPLDLVAVGGQPLDVRVFGGMESARRAIDSGEAVALASRFGPSASTTCNMAAVMAQAWSGISPAEAIAAATINGAHALGIPRLAGSLEAGKQADAVVFEVSDYRDIVRYFGVNLITAVVKRGRVLYRHGEVAWPAGS